MLNLFVTALCRSHHSSQIFDETFATSKSNLFFAGQMTGVEGYVESAASGLVTYQYCASFQG